MTVEHPPVVRSPLGLRLMAGFVAVAVAAVFVLVGLMLWRTEHSVGQLARERQQATADAIADTLALGYQQNGGWEGTDPHAAMMLAVQAGASLTVLDADGSALELRSRMGNLPAAVTDARGPHRSAPVVVDGATVGSAEITFVSGELAHSESHVRDALSGAVLIGALVAAVVALLVAVPLARRIVQPLRRVTDAAHRLGAGEPSARVGDHDAPGEIGVLAVAFDDMADRLQAQDLARRTLTADVAHELRTPLTLLQGNCEEVIDGITEPTMAHFVQMHDDILRLRRVVDDLGTLAEADAAATEPRVRFESCDVAEVAGRAADALQPMIEAHQHQLVRTLQPARVEGDPARLVQIVTNLLVNAVKFTPAGGNLWIDVRIDQPTGGGVAEAVLTVGDDGPGIAAADRPHVFERFYRGAAARTSAGSGIGLAVVAQLAAAHGGSAEVGEVAAGAAIVVRIPTVRQYGR